MVRIDIVPTIAHELGVDLPWDADGQPIGRGRRLIRTCRWRLGPPAEPDARLRRLRAPPGGRAEADDLPVRPRRRRGSALYANGAEFDLLGRRRTAFASAPAGGVRVELDSLRPLTTSDPARTWCPASSRGVEAAARPRHIARGGGQRQDDHRELPRRRRRHLPGRDSAGQRLQRRFELAGGLCRRRQVYSDGSLRSRPSVQRCLTGFGRRMPRRRSRVTGGPTRSRRGACRATCRHAGAGRSVPAPWLGRRPRWAAAREANRGLPGRGGRAGPADLGTARHCGELRLDEVAKCGFEGGGGARRRPDDLRVFALGKDGASDASWLGIGVATVESPSAVAPGGHLLAWVHLGGAVVVRDRQAAVRRPRRLA